MPIKGGRYSYYTSKALVYALEDVSESAARILMEDRQSTVERTIGFQRDVLTANQVAETLAEATGRKFATAVRTAELFRARRTADSIFEPAYAKGGLEFFRYVEDGRMAYVGNVKDDTEKFWDASLVAEAMGKITRHRDIGGCGQLRLLNYFCFRLCGALGGGYLQTVRARSVCPRVAVIIANQNGSNQWRASSKSSTRALGLRTTPDTFLCQPVMEATSWRSRATLIGKAADAFYSGKEYEFTLERRARMKGGGLRPIRILRSPRDGTRVPVIISAVSCGPDGSPFLVLHNVPNSQQKKRNRILREANAHSRIALTN